MNLLLSELLNHADPEQVNVLSWFFKTGPGQYGEGDRFLGIKVPVVRKVVGQTWLKIGFQELGECLSSEYHEVRLGGLLTLVKIFSHPAKYLRHYSLDVSTDELKKVCVDFYLTHRPYKQLGSCGSVLLSSSGGMASRKGQVNSL